MHISSEQLSPMYEYTLMDLRSIGVPRFPVPRDAYAHACERMRTRTFIRLTSRDRARTVECAHVRLLALHDLAASRTHI